MKQSSGLIKIDRAGHVRRNRGSTPSRLSNSIDLDGKQYRKIVFSQFRGECDCLRGAPTVAVNDNSRLVFFGGRRSAVMIAGEGRKT